MQVGESNMGKTVSFKGKGNEVCKQRFLTTASVRGGDAAQKKKCAPVLQLFVLWPTKALSPSK